MPPAASIAWNASQAFAASWSVRLSTYQEPPAGSLTRPMFDSSAASSWVLRAIRRLKSSGRPTAVSNGSVVIASAPPTAAENVAIVPRSRFTYGSSLVIMRQEVTACCTAPRDADGTPETSPIRAHRRRSARRRAIVRNSSALAETRKQIWPKAAAGETPAASRSRR